MNRAERRALGAGSRKRLPELMRHYVDEAGHAVIALVNGIGRESLLPGDLAIDLTRSILNVDLER